MGPTMFELPLNDSLPVHVVTTRIGDVPRDALAVRYIPAELLGSVEVACEWTLTREVQVTDEDGQTLLYPAGEMVRRDGWVCIKAAPRVGAQQASIG